MLTRRNFLQSALGLLSYQLLPSISLGQGLRPHNLLFLELEGGWDTSLATDPWLSDRRPDEKSYFIEYTTNELIPFQNSFVGPAMKPLQAYFDRLTIINGIYISANDNGHEAAKIYMESGNGQGEYPHLATEADLYKFKSPMGTAAGVSVYRGPTNRAILDVESVRQAKAIKTLHSVAIENQKSTDLTVALSNLEQHREAIEKFNKSVSGQGQNLADLDVVISLFKSGLCRTAVLRPRMDPDVSLDTHAQHENAHKTALEGLLGRVSQILDRLKETPSSYEQGQSLLDETTVVIFSEFTRTPALNSSRGKDHNPQSNSLMILGPQFRPGKIGAARLVDRRSSKIGLPYLVGTPLKENEQVAQNKNEAAFFIRPETVLATICEGLGLDRRHLNYEIQNTRLLKSILK